QKAHHLIKKRKQADQRLRSFYWLMGRRSKLRTSTKILIYKAIIRPIWTYGIQLWGTASKTNVRTIQTFENRALRIATGDHVYHDNRSIHEVLNFPWVKDEIQRSSARYMQRLHNHPNLWASSLVDNSEQPRRLKRTHPLDLTLLLKF
ncbi:hypothetical protein KR074_002088, partial [Drosophila pseudoananassae]